MDEASSQHNVFLASIVRLVGGKKMKAIVILSGVFRAQSSELRRGDDGGGGVCVGNVAFVWDAVVESFMSVEMKQSVVSKDGAVV